MLIERSTQTMLQSKHWPVPLAFEANKPVGQGL